MSATSVSRPLLIVILSVLDGDVLRLRGGEGTPPRELEPSTDLTPLVFVQDADVMGLITSDLVMWPGRLNGWHSYVTSGSLEHVRSVARDRIVRLDRSERQIVVDIPAVCDLISNITFLSRSQLQEVSRLHHIRTGRKKTKE